MTVEILRIHEDYVTKTMFTFTCTEWLASAGATKFQNRDIRNVKGRTECLFEVFLHVCEEEQWHVLQNPLEPPLIISFARRRTTSRFPRSLTRQINY